MRAKVAAPLRRSVTWSEPSKDRGRRPEEGRRRVCGGGRHGPRGTGGDLHHGAQRRHPKAHRPMPTTYTAQTFREDTITIVMMLPQGHGAN